MFKNNHKINSTYLKKSKYEFKGFEIFSRNNNENTKIIDLQDVPFCNKLSIVIKIEIFIATLTKQKKKQDDNGIKKENQTH